MKLPSSTSRSNPSYVFESGLSIVQFNVAQVFFWTRGDIPTLMLDFDNDGNACRPGIELSWIKMEMAKTSNTEYVFPIRIRRFHLI
jgi:hypothetical protein